MPVLLRRPLVCFATTLLAAGLAGTSATPALARSQEHFQPAQATAAFGLDLMRKLPTGNLVFSPDSIEAALAMTGEGAVGQTAAQIAGALRLPSPASFAQVGALQRRILATQAKAGHGTSAPVLDIAQTLFLQSGFAAEPGFVAELSSGFSATPQTVNFRREPRAAAMKVDAWVNRETHGLIPEALGSVSPRTLMALVNAVYLKATWAKQFEPERTFPATFHAPGGDMSTPFMHQFELMRYGEGSGYSLVELPYLDSDLALDVILPNGQSVERLLSTLEPSTLQRMLREASVHEVQLSLPKFKIAFSQNLTTMLGELGMTDAFNGQANFSRISHASPLHLGVVQHDAYISVNEQGTEAAATTIGGLEPTGRSARPRAEFDADRPFLFFLSETHTGAILFAGRVSNPSAG